MIISTITATFCYHWSDTIAPHTFHSGIKLWCSEKSWEVTKKNSENCWKNMKNPYENGKKSVFFEIQYINSVWCQKSVFVRINPYVWQHRSGFGKIKKDREVPSDIAVLVPYKSKRTITGQWASIPGVLTGYTSHTKKIPYFSSFFKILGIIFRKSQIWELMTYPQNILYDDWLMTMGITSNNLYKPVRQYLGKIFTQQKY